MNDAVFKAHGPTDARRPLVPDSPHSGFPMPPGFGSVHSAGGLQDGEGGFIDELYRPAVARSVPLACADAAAGRSRPLEVNKRLHRQQGGVEKLAGFATLQRHWMLLIDAVLVFRTAEVGHG